MTNAMIEKHTLDNGLTLLTKEIHNAPVVSFWVWYRVGSRNESKGQTGISHWVEHMQFKGTEKYPVNVLDAEISKVGGYWNAMTYLDWTTYYETLPANQVGIAIDLEADRMVNSIFDPKETELERTVIISEREGNENEPLFRLSEALRKGSFTTHPYSQQVIGEMADLRSITREDLYAHYQHYYNPANAVIAVAGDFSTRDLVAQIISAYGRIPSRKIVGENIPQETRIENPGRVVVEGPGDTLYIELAYRSPAAEDEDFFPLMVLDSLLSGPSSLSMFGGGSISNKTSRLYKCIVEKDLAVSISGGLQTTIDPYIYSILAIAPPEADVGQIISAVDVEISDIHTQLVSPEELARAKKQARALFAYGSESITNQAFWMGYSAMFADYRWFENYLEQISRVTSDQIQRVALKYLLPEQRVLGIYEPTGAD